MKNVFAKVYALWKKLILNRKKTWVEWLFLLSLPVGMVFVLALPVFGLDVSLEGVANGVMMAVSNVALSLGELCIRLTIFCLRFFIDIASFNNYVDNQMVMLGWTMVRDVANMFFVVVLLAIAIGTILGIEQYQWNKTLVKLILAAVFINFSNLICGVFIDAAQVFTMTFVNAVAATAGGNLINMFHLNDMFTLVNDKKLSSGNVVDVAENMNLRLLSASIAAFLFAFLALVSMAAYTVMMLIRMVVLWILIILSPIAFIAQIIPQGQSMASEWWSEFGKNVLVAPLMVFFLWLAFATAGQGQLAADLGMKIAESSVAQEGEYTESELGGGEEAATMNKITQWSTLSNLLIPIAILWVGLERVQKLGAKGGQLVGKAGDTFKKAAGYVTGLNAAKWAGQKAVQGVKLAGKAALMNAPIVGGKAWQRRGAWAKEKGLRLGEMWNKSGGALTGLQFGKHDKIMKERAKAIEQMQGRVGSSVKGWMKGFSEESRFAPLRALGKTGNFVGGKMLDKIPLLNMAVGGADKLKDHVDKLEGEGEMRKARSDAKRAKNRANAGTAMIYDKNGKLTTFGKTFSERKIDQDVAEAKKETVLIKGKLEVLQENMEGGDEGNKGFFARKLGAIKNFVNKGDIKKEKERPGNYYHALADSLTAQNAFANQRNVGVNEVEIKKNEEEEQELEKKQAEALDDNKDVAVVNEMKDNQAIVHEEEKKQATVEGSMEKLTQEINDLDKFISGKEAELKNVKDQLKKDDEEKDPIKKLSGDKRKELTDKEADLGKDISDAKTEKEAKQKELALMKKAEDPNDTDNKKVIELLQKIVEANNGVKTAIGEIESDTSKGGLKELFESTYGKGTQINNDFLKNQDTKALCALVELQSDRKKNEQARKFVENEDNQEKYVKSSRNLEDVKENVLKEMVKSGKHLSISSAYYEALNQFKAIQAHKNKSSLQEQVVQNAVLDKVGIASPSQALGKAIDELKSNYLKNMEKEPLSDAYGLLLRKITQKANDPTKIQVTGSDGKKKETTVMEEYKHSGEYDQENLLLKAVADKLVELKYLDDQVGKSEDYTMENLDNLVKKMTSKLGVKDDNSGVIREALVKEINKKSGDRGSQRVDLKIDWDLKLGQMKTDGNLAADLKSVLAVLKQKDGTLDKLLNGNMVSSGEMKTLEENLRKNAPVNTRLNLGEVIGMLNAANKDQRFSKNLQNFIK